MDRARSASKGTGRICLVTGATSGIGAVTALELARRGDTVLVVGRNPARCAATVAHLRRQTGNPAVEALVADLSSRQDVRRLAREVQDRFPRLDVLLNNAGALFLKRRLSVDGIEMTFALNHLGYFLLTGLLLDRLKASAPARVINVASAAHRRTTMNFDDLQGVRSYRGFRAYCQSKLANLLFTYELARRLEGTGVTVNALHPGVVATRFGTNNWLWRLWRPIFRLFSISPARGARTMTYLATSPEVERVTGKYFVKEQVVASSPDSYDRAAALRLWRVSEELTGLTVTG
jgi:NAD(P)-dependent dehydrogenase (short-subunit alcohol dehydrogenase family)